ncbi:MAG TPA: helix-hairpin-helix domain-containing protein [Thermodesulfobacteriota bacterium]|nr:helix-hairpin-helix domain-containing protein [Thermodesulfobacteriota bacterium]
MKKNLLFLVCDRPLLSLALFCLLVFGLHSSWFTSHRYSAHSPQAINNDQKGYIEFVKNGEFPVVTDLDNVRKGRDVFPPGLPESLRNGDKIVIDDNGAFTVSRIEGRKSVALGIPIGINSSSLEDLIILPGIGNTLAHRIVEYRELNKGYKSVDELVNVKGIGSKKLEAIKALVSID